MKFSKLQFEILSSIAYLLKLKGGFYTCEAKKRAIEKFGDRDYVKNQVQIVIKYLKDSGVIEKQNHGSYVVVENISLDFEPKLLDLILKGETVVEKRKFVNHPIWTIFSMDESILGKFHTFMLGVNQEHLELI